MPWSRPIRPAKAIPGRYRTGRLNINTYTYKNKKLKNRKLKRKRKQKRKRGSLREGREAPPRRCPHPIRFCFRFRFNFRIFKLKFFYSGGFNNHSPKLVSHLPTADGPSEPVTMAIRRLAEIADLALRKKRNQKGL